VKSSKVIAAHRIQQEMNFTHEKTTGSKDSFFQFLQVVFYCSEKNWPYNLPEKTSKVKILPVCQILQNFIKGSIRKFTVCFTFCAYFIE